MDVTMELRHMPGGGVAVRRGGHTVALRAPPTAEAAKVLHAWGCMGQPVPEAVPPPSARAQPPPARTTGKHGELQCALPPVPRRVHVGKLRLGNVQYSHDVLGNVQTVKHTLTKRASRAAETVETENPLAGAAPAPRAARPADNHQQQQAQAQQQGRPALMKKARRRPPSLTAEDVAAADRVVLEATSELYAEVGHDPALRQILDTMRQQADQEIRSASHALQCEQLHLRVVEENRMAIARLQKAEADAAGVYAAWGCAPPAGSPRLARSDGYLAAVRWEGRLDAAALFGSLPKSLSFKQRKETQLWRCFGAQQCLAFACGLRQRAPDSDVVKLIAQCLRSLLGEREAQIEELHAQVTLEKLTAGRKRSVVRRGHDAAGRRYAIFHPRDRPPAVPHQ